MRIKLCKAVILFSVFLLTACFFLHCTSQDCTVRNLGIFIKNKDSSIAGQDGCTPIQLNETTMLWTFGDTILGSWKDKISVSTTFEQSAIMKGMISSSLATTAIPNENTIDSLNFKYSKKNGKITELFLRKKNEQSRNIRIWPLDGIRIKNSIYLYYIKVQLNPNSKKNPISVIHNGISKSAVRKDGKSIIPAKFKRIKVLFKKNEPHFGDSVIRRGNYLFITGRSNNSENKKITANIAKTPINFINNRNKYTFLTCSGTWQKDINKACGYFGNVAGEYSLSYNNHIKKFILIYCGLDGKIRLIYSNKLENLHQKEPTIIYIPQKLSNIKNRSFLFYYSAKEIFANQYFLYIIYIHPAIYQPILLQIPYCAFYNENNE